MTPLDLHTHHAAACNRAGYCDTQFIPVDALFRNGLRFADWSRRERVRAVRPSAVVRLWRAVRRVRW